jgi:hypothetical protein
MHPINRHMTAKFYKKNDKLFVRVRHTSKEYKVLENGKVQIIPDGNIFESKEEAYKYYNDA